MVQDPRAPIDPECPELMPLWCVLAGLALAPMPIWHAYPVELLYHLFETPPPGWVRFTSQEAIWFVVLGLPLAPVFLAWSLPGAARPGVPARSLAVLCVLLAYNPLRHYFESHFYGEGIAGMAGSITWDSPIRWVLWHLDTPLLVGLAVTALLQRRGLRPIGKVLFHWVLFVCALWAAGPLYDILFYWINVAYGFAQ